MRTRPPWERFARWLRRQPNNRKFATNPVQAFLDARGIPVTVGPRLMWRDGSTVPNYPSPSWVYRFLYHAEHRFGQWHCLTVGQSRAILRILGHARQAHSLKQNKVSA